MANVGGVTITFTGDASGVDAALQRMSRVISDRMTAIEARLASGEQATKQFSERSAKHLQVLTESFNQMQRTVSRVMGALASVGVGVSLGGLVKDAVAVAASFETLEVRLRFLTDSVEEFNKARAFIIEFARTTPLQLDQVGDAFVRLTASGFEAAKMLPILVDAVSQFGGGNESLQSLIVNLQQMATQAKVSGQELRDIARGSLIPAFQIVSEEARKMGITISDSAAKAGISGRQAIELLLKGMQERFKGATVIMATTWTQLVSNLVDQWKIFADTVLRSSGLFDAMKGAAFLLFTTLDKAITDNRKTFKDWGVAVLNSIRQVGGSIAVIIDLVNSFQTEAGTPVQETLADWERKGGAWMGKLYNRIASMIGLSADFTGEIQGSIAEVKRLASSGEALKAFEAAMDAIIAQGEEFRKTQEGIQGKKPVFAAPPAAADTEGAKAAARRAKEEEDILAASLKKQEALIETSFDDRRRLLDEQVAAQLQAEPGNVRAIAAARTALVKTMAIEEARALEAIRLASLDRQLAAQLHTLDLEIAAHAGDAEKLAKIEELKVKATEDAGAKRAEITKKTGEVELGISKRTVDEQIKQAEAGIKRIEQIEERRLQARIDVSEAQIALVQAQVEGEVLTAEQGAQQIRAIQVQRLADSAELYRKQAKMAIDAISEEVAATQEGKAQIAEINDRLASRMTELTIRQKTETRQFLNEQEKSWREWVRDVQQSIGSFLVDVFEGQVRSITDLFDRLKSYFFRIIAEMIAYAATHAIVVPIVSAVLGGTGGGVAGQAVAGAGLLSRLFGGTGGTGTATGGTGGTSGGGLLETGGTALTGVGLARSVYNMLGLDALSGYVGTGLTSLKDTMVAGIGSVFKSSAVAAQEQALLESALVEQGAGVTPAGQAAGFAGQIAGVAGGLAALGGGIYAALNASNNAARAAYAASAAAGAFAAATAGYAAVVGTAAATTAAGTGWTGIGLIVAAVMAVVGIVLDKVIKPEGPSLSVGRPGGLNITREGDRLGVGGDLGTRVTRREGPSPAFAVGVQAQMESGITAAVTAMVQTINAVALDPGALLEPTQNALQAALRAIQPLNTANADKMTSDITEQLKFINVAIVGGLLEPVNKAFDQLRDQGTLTQQMERLPGTVSGMVAIFKNLNEQLDQINKGENTDVLRQVSQVRNQIENFGNRLAGTAGQVAESIVTQITELFKTQVDTTLAGQITQFAGLLNTSIGALGLLRQTQQTIEGVGLPGGGVGGQIDRLVTAINATSARVSTEIVTTALQGLSTDLKTILVEPLRVQASTVNSLFNDAMATLAALGTQWQNLSNVGLDTMAIQGQFSRLLDGILGTVQQVLSEAFTGGDFGEFLAVLGSIPEAVTNLNPVWAQLRQIGAVFAQVVGPIVQTVGTLEDELRSTSERVAFATDRISELRGSLVDVGSAVDRALPLYAQLAQAMQAQAAAQIQLIHEQAEAMRATATAWIEGQRGRIEAEVDRVTDFWNTWADGERDALDARIQAERDALDVRVQAEREALDVWVTAMTTAVNAWAETATTTANQLQTVNESILAEQSPAKQRAALEAQKAGLINVINTTGSQAAIGELIRVEQQLLALAKQSNNLAGMQSVLDELATIQGSLTTSLAASTGQTDPFMATQVVQQAQADSLATIAAAQKTQTEAITFWQQVETDRITASQDAQTARIQQTLDDNLGALQTVAQAQYDYLASQQAQTLRDITAWEEANVRAVKEDLITQLRVLEAALQNLFAGQQIVQSLLHAPIPVTLVGQAAQRGGIIGLSSGQYYAQGGMVPAMLEPGERVFSGMNRMQMGALTQMNNAFPRFSGGGFMVPGSGSGDTVPMLLPSHSFVLNRRASGAMGMQGGGYVSAPSSRTVEKSVVIHVDLRGSQFSKNVTLEEFKALMRELERRGYQR